MNQNSIAGTCLLYTRRSTCLTLHFQMGSRMLFIDSRNSNKMAAVYTVHTSSIRRNIFLMWPQKLIKVAGRHFFGVTNWLHITRQSDEDGQTSNWCLTCFFNRQLVSRLWVWPATSSAISNVHHQYIHPPVTPLWPSGLWIQVCTLISNCEYVLQSAVSPDLITEKQA